MSVSGDRLFARVGSQVTVRQPNAFSPRFEGNRLVCLSLAREGSSLWKYPLEQDEVEFEQEGWAFEGPPICDGDRVYVAMRRSQSPPEAYVACFDIQKFESRVEKVSLKWRRRICSADTPGHGQLNELTHNLLTLAEGKLYYNTNLGAVAALSADDGTLLWAYSYPRAVAGHLYEPPPHFYRDLNPCIYHQGLVIAAPTDCDSIIALDAGTGELVWRAWSNTEHPIHLLGVGGGNLIATGSSVWWIDAVNGKLRAVWPETGNGGAVRGYGRGLLAGGNIYWPTREEIFVFDQRVYLEGGRRDIALKQRIRLTQDQLDEPGQDRPPVTGGNLVVADRKLLVATADHLFAFDLLSDSPPVAKAKDGT
jgi:outer membrane protein assembly factor BamB